MTFFTDPLTQRVLDQLDRGTASVFVECLTAYEKIAGDPEAAVVAHVASLRAAAVANEFLDLEQAEQLGKRCHGLLEQIGPGTLEGCRKLILAAVYYFILDEDAESDSDSILGLEDDEQVIAAVEAVLKNNA